MNTRKLVVSAFLIALCYAGANFKIMGSIAFDSLPAFLGALMLGNVYGAVIAAIGHILSAVLSGFPLSLPVHIIIMIAMAVTMWAFGGIFRHFKKSIGEVKALIISSIIAVVINGPIQLLIVAPMLLSTYGVGGIISMLPVLTMAAFFNVVIADLIYIKLPERYKNYFDE